jgi:hypothetical protein
VYAAHFRKKKPRQLIWNLPEERQGDMELRSSAPADRPPRPLPRFLQLAPLPPARSSPDPRPTPTLLVSAVPRLALRRNDERHTSPCTASVPLCSDPAASRATSPATSAPPTPFFARGQEVGCSLRYVRYMFLLVDGSLMYVRCGRSPDVCQKTVGDTLMYIRCIIEPKFAEGKHESK